MSGQEWAFIIVGGVGGLSAIRMVTTNNVVHGALYLVVTLAMVGGAYLLLAAEFVAWVQIVIYVGAIVVLLLFSLMLTKAPTNPLPTPCVGRGCCLRNMSSGFGARSVRSSLSVSMSAVCIVSMLTTAGSTRRAISTNEADNASGARTACRPSCATALRPAKPFSPRRPPVASWSASSKNATERGGDEETRRTIA